MIKIVTNQQNHLNISQCSSRTHSLTNSIRNKPRLVLNNFSILQEVFRNELVWLGPVLRILWCDDLQFMNCNHSWYQTGEVPCDRQSGLLEPEYPEADWIHPVQHHRLSCASDQLVLCLQSVESPSRWPWCRASCIASPTSPHNPCQPPDQSLSECSPAHQGGKTGVWEPTSSSLTLTLLQSQRFHEQLKQDSTHWHFTGWD